jgi:hypothetical protein
MLAVGDVINAEAILHPRFHNTAVIIPAIQRFDLAAIKKSLPDAQTSG